MFPDMPSTTRPDVIAVVALADPVVLRMMVTSGLDELRRISTEGMHIFLRAKLARAVGTASDRGDWDNREAYRECDDHDKAKEAVGENSPKHCCRNGTLGITGLLAHMDDTLEG